MNELVKEDYIITLLDNAPFTKTPSKPTAYISSDGGHGGMEEIYYCPFCGLKITITEED